MVRNLTQELMDAFREAKSEYEAARPSRFRRRRSDVTSSGYNADWHYRNESDFIGMSELFRAYDRNVPLVSSAVDRIVSETFPKPFRVDPKTGSDELDDHLEARFTEWSEDKYQCDIQGKRNFNQLLESMFRQVAVEGESLAVGLDSGQLQAFESHRIKTPRGVKRPDVIHGVQVNGAGRPLAYWVTTQDVGFNHQTKPADFTQYPAFEEFMGREWPVAFHLQHCRRVSQTRGISPMAPVADVIGMHDDVQFAQLVKQQMVSAWAILVEQSGDPAVIRGASGGMQLGTRTTTSNDDGSNKIVENVGPGMVVRAPAGNKVTGFSPNTPNPTFFDHAKLLITFIANAFRIPYSVLMMDPSEGNFANMRWAMSIMRRGLAKYHQDIVAADVRPIYHWKVRQFLQADPKLMELAIESRANPFSAGFFTPGEDYIHPVEDRQADLLDLRNMLSSPRRVHSKRGNNFYEIVEETIFDNGFAIERAIQKANDINSRFNLPTPITWREILNMPTPDGVSYQLPVQQPAQQGANNG